MSQTEANAERLRLGLRAECSDCFGLCCVATLFIKSTEFAVDKPAGEPCGNLDNDFRCGIHTQLRGRGFSGCEVFDCLGAGQKVSQHTFGATDWREDASTAQQMFTVFGIMRQLHELLWSLTEALALPAVRATQSAQTQTLHDQLRTALEETDNLTRANAQALVDADLPALRGRINVLLASASELARADAPGSNYGRRDPDLIGANLAGADLRGADLSGALLMTADLSGADLRLADVNGAALLDADLSGADLRDCIFLTQSQLNSANGDPTTLLPAGMTRPAHWTTTPQPDGGGSSKG